MIATVDERRRLTMPEDLPPQTLVSVDAAGAGRWLVTELKPARARPSPEEVLQAIEASTWQSTAAWDEIRLVTRDGRKLLTGGPKLTGAQIAESIDLERDERDQNLL
jgi:hypothetical protein